MVESGHDQEDLSMSQATEQLTYAVPGMSCGHCRAAVESEVGKVAGVASVEVDLDAKRVTVAGEQLDDEAGYDVA